jgi:topoisomerase IV subunit A
MDKDLDMTESEGLEKLSSDFQPDRETPGHQLVHLPGMYKDWFLEYASYVILERAVPHVDDGLKPVQRRILHSMKNLDDGRYNKVANLIGHTMQYHPHGDASIGDALVQLGQKELLIDMQGNWGNIFTGDGAAAPRYIEARLSKFALEVVFNPKTTSWKPSYDGRNKEPITLPVKFPLLLAQGVEGIAVGLASKILPHNFLELIEASIAYLQGRTFELFPDFPTGGYIDVSKYNHGLRGGAVKIRAKIEKYDNKTLIISEIPFGKNTGTLIDSILKANERGKIKIKKVDDNTAEHVEILIHLAPGVSSDKTIDALYAFTDCELSISPNSCIIENEKPAFLPIHDILVLNTNRTRELLLLELQIQKSELEEEWHFSSLEKIFIENKIYRDIEEALTFEDIISFIDKGLEPFKHLLKRVVTREDILNLIEIKIKRISKFDSLKADEKIRSIEEDILKIIAHIQNITNFTIDYFKGIKSRYGKGKERKTEIRNFDTIIATKVAVANEKLYVNRAEGFAGYGLKKEEYLCECSDIDDIIVFRRDGKFLVTKVTEKAFVGKDILHIAVFKQNDMRTIYNAVYKDGKGGPYLIKRFFVKGITRDKEYDLTKGSSGSRIMYFSANPNGEAESIRIILKPKSNLRKLNFESDFSEVAIKSRSAIGNILTKHEIHRISLKEKGLSTLGGRKIWFDEDVSRLNADGRGRYLGEFHSDDRILVISNEGWYQLTNFDLTNHYSEKRFILEKYQPGKLITSVHFDGEQGFYYLKRFEIEPVDKPAYFINNEHPESRLVSLSDDYYARLTVNFGGKDKEKESIEIDAEEFIGIKSYKARGKRISTYEIKKISWLEPLRQPELIQEEKLSAEKSEDEDSVDFELPIGEENTSSPEIPPIRLAEVKAQEEEKANPEETTKVKRKTSRKSKSDESNEFDDIEFEIEDTRNQQDTNKPGIDKNGQLTLF